MSPKFKDKFTGVSAHLLSSISLTHDDSNSYISLAIQGRGITSGKTKKTDAFLHAVNILIFVQASHRVTLQKPDGF